MSKESIISPCDFFQVQSRYVWKRIEFAREMNLRISETSITEELLYRFYQFFLNFGIPVRLFESKEEHKNGSDIEVLIKTSHGYILLACQAKITYKSGKYKSFHHEVGGKRQIDLLQNYAKKKGGIAQYLLYNFVPEFMMSNDLKDLDNLDEFGITHIAADKVSNWLEECKKIGQKPIVPNFSCLHPKTAKPFHELICLILKDEVSFIERLPSDLVNAITYYSERQVSDDPLWRQVSSNAKIGYIEETAQNIHNKDIDSRRLVEKQRATPEFKPKFRIVVGGDIDNGALYRIS